MTTVPSEIRASKSFNASTENLLLFFAGFVADWVTRVQDGTLEADAGRNAWEIYRADPREGSHPDECVSPHSRVLFIGLWINKSGLGVGLSRYA